MSGMLEHLSARFFARPTFLSTLFHHGVIFEGRTCLGTSLTGFGTSGANDIAEWPLAGHNARSSSAHCRAVLAGLKRLEVFFFPLGNTLGAVRSAGITNTSAIITSFGTGHAMFVMFSPGR